MSQIYCLRFLELSGPTRLTVYREIAHDTWQVRRESLNGGTLQATPFQNCDGPTTFPFDIFREVTGLQKVPSGTLIVSMLLPVENFTILYKDPDTSEKKYMHSSSYEGQNLSVDPIGKS